MEQFGYSLHHVIAILFLWFAYYYTELRHLTYLFGVIETSNLCSYAVYHCLKSGYSDKVIERLREIQVTSYVFFRIPVLGFVMYDMWDYFREYNLTIFMVIIYLMGVHWSYKLWTGLSNYYKNKTIKLKENTEEVTENTKEVTEEVTQNTVEVKENKEKSE